MIDNLFTFVRTLGNQRIEGKKFFTTQIGVLGALSDGNSSLGTSGYVLSSTGTGVEWVPAATSSVEFLDDLSDVIITTPSSGQLLRYGIPLGSEESQPVWYNFTPNYLTPSSSIDALGDVNISTATAGQILQWNGSQWANATLSTVEYVSKVQHTVKCGVAITKGQAVYVTSADGTNMIVGLASNASEATSSKTMGLAASTGAINAQIFVVTEGLLAGLDTSTASAGDPVWLGTNGNLIFGLANKPVAPAHLVFIGIVTRVQQNNGEIFVKVQNGFELNEIHDVKITSLADNDSLVYNATTALWENKPITYVHTQGSASSAWTINHPLNKFPSVDIVDSANSVVIGQIEYISASQIIVYFNNPFSGKAYLN